MFFQEIKSPEKCKDCGEWFGDHSDNCPNMDN